MRSVNIQVSLIQIFILYQQSLTVHWVARFLIDLYGLMDLQIYLLTNWGAFTWTVAFSKMIYNRSVIVSNDRTVLLKFTLKRNCK